MVRMWLMLGLLLCGCRGDGQVPPPAGALDAIVVLGHRPPRDENGVEYETRARVEQGVRLFRQGRAERLLFSGGESTPGVIEADVMAEYARELGVDPSALLREGASRDTIENARLSVARLRQLTPARPPRVWLVTSDYHLGRAARLFRCAGAEVHGSGVPLQDGWAARAGRRLREFGVRFAYVFIDECARVRGE